MSGLDLGRMEANVAKAAGEGGYGSLYVEDVGDLIGRVRVLEEALRFYAREDNYVPDEECAGVTGVEADEGRRARKALSGGEG